MPRGVQSNLSQLCGSVLYHNELTRRLLTLILTEVGGGAESAAVFHVVQDNFLDSNPDKTMKIGKQG